MKGVARIATRFSAGVLGAALWCFGTPTGASAELLGEKGGSGMGLTITSTAFAREGEIPEKHTCDGDDLSPELSWAGVPPGTRSLALIVDDPDAPDPAAPRTVWVHWVLYNIPPGVTGLPERTGNGNLPDGALEGVNDWKAPGYRGPCPPIGRHRYFFKLYALDTVLPDLRKPGKARLLQAMEGHVLATDELMGTYRKGR